MYDCSREDGLLAWTLSCTPRKRHHVFVQLADFLIADQPTLGPIRLRVREDVRVMMVYMRGGGNYGLKGVIRYFEVDSKWI